jgi:putative spermidine/putrescine transport system ATP-binding protein
MAQVRLSAVAKSFGRSVALHATDLEIRDGEFFTFLGPSGSGKTTLLRMIGGFVDPSAGRIEIGGQDVTGLPAHRRNLGVVFQSYALFPHLTVLANVAFGLKMRGVARTQRERRALEALDLVGLSEFVARFPAQLSGGQQQRVALARAMVIEPDVLLLDEPLGALDLALRKRMQRELRALHRKLGRTFIFVTHDQDEALTLSDRIAVLADGRVQQVDTPEALYDRPTSAFVASFLGDSNILTGTVSAEGFHLPDGALVLVEPGGHTGPAALAIRPERIRLAASGRDEVRLTGKVSTLMFRGAFVTMTVQTSSGLDVDVALTGGVERLSQGDSVTLAFDPADARLLMDGVRA